MVKEYIILFSVLIVCITANVGPVGYDLFRKTDEVSQLRTGVHTRQFSSFDRQGGNADGGPYECIKKLANGHCILAEWLGSGEIDSIWMTRDNGVFNKTGNVVIELDGQTVLNKRLQDVYDSKTGLPFSWPLVGNGADTSGGGVIKVPMPFTKSMRVITDTDPVYYHVTYRTFSDSTNVKRFDPTESATDVLDQIRGFGVRDPKPVKANTKTVKTTLSSVPADLKQIIFEQTNTSGVIRQIRIQIPHLVRSPRNIDDGRAFGKGGWSQFTATIDARNAGIRITRRLDPSVHNEVASITIDGAAAGHWNSSKLTQSGVWGEETVEIDPKLTKDKTHITVRQEFISSSYDFNEFRYETDSLIDGQWIRTDVAEVGPDHPGEEGAHMYKNNAETFAGVRIFRYPIDPKSVADSDQFLAKTRIRATFDGKVTVDAPFGEFFGSGLGMYDTRSFWFGIDARNAMFTTWWPMPFAKDAKVEIVFASNSEASNMRTDVSYVSDANIGKSLSSRKVGYFHATHRNETTVPGHDYIFLNTTGHGIFYGVTHTMRGLIKTGNIRDYLEGDERAFVDGSQSPDIYGTGTEDFYEGGWYFRGGVTYDMPFAGNPAYETQGDDCLYDCTGAIRVYPGGVSYESSILFGIEHGPVDDNEPGIYSSVAYSYSLPEPVIKETDFVDLIDKESRDKHNYKANGEKSYQMKSSYEGEHYKVIKTANVTTATGDISFNVKIDANNNGIRIFRTGDQEIAYQCVEVHVNNQISGQWLQPLGNKWSRFLDDSHDIPSNITKGKTELSVKLVPVSHDSGPVIWSASHYKIMSIIE